MGRTTKLTPEVHDKIVALMRAGNYFAIACEAAGISRNTGYRWKNWGDPDLTDDDARKWKTRDPKTAPPITTKAREPYRRFRDAVSRAEAEAEAEVVVHVRRGIPKDPRVGIEYLQRRSPDRWGRQRHDVHHEGEVGLGGPVVDALEEYGETLQRLAEEAHPSDPDNDDDTEDEGNG